jgi:triosephosphate isomerase
MYYKDSGAYTGEISPVMLKETGVKRVMIGHSERRHIFGEDDNLIAHKVLSAFHHGIMPIVCIGEKLDERENNKTFEVIDTQLSKGLTELSEDFLKDIVIAYEPVWAIGTGMTATPAQAQDVHFFIRSWFEKKINLSVAKKIRILYGGSVTPDNIKSLMDCPDVDGALVGGASLKNDLFTKIIKYDII